MVSFLLPMWKGVLFVDICNTFSNKQRETELVKLFKILKFWARQVNEDDPMNHTYTLEVWCRVNALIKKLHNDVTNCGGVPWWNGGLISLMCLSAKTSWLDALFPPLHSNHKAECTDMRCSQSFKYWSFSHTTACANMSLDTQS